MGSQQRMIANNIFKFPLKGKPRSEEEVLDYLKNNKVKFVDTLVEHYGSQVLTKLAQHGIGIYEKEFMCDYLFVMESLKSALLRNLGEEHPIQELVSSDLNKYTTKS
jgi:hypothetical protein